MRRQFDDMRAAGEPIAALWASEGRIYQRFGYGLAARRMAVSVDLEEVRLSDRFPSVGTLREEAPADVVEAMAKVYDEAYARQPGWSERTPRHWDPHRSGVVARRRLPRLRAVVHAGDHGVDGYALWRVKNRVGRGRPGGRGVRPGAGQHHPGGLHRDLALPAHARSHPDDARVELLGQRAAAVHGQRTSAAGHPGGGRACGYGWWTCRRPWRRGGTRPTSTW